MKELKDKSGDYTGDALQNQFTAYVKLALIRNRVSYFRKQMAREQSVLLYAREADFPSASRSSGPTDTLSLSSVHNEALIHAISQLSDKDRTIIRLRVLYGYPYKRIAAILGITPDTANVRYLRAIAKLRKRLEAGQ